MGEVIKFPKRELTEQEKETRHWFANERLKRGDWDGLSNREIARKCFEYADMMMDIERKTR